MAKNPNPSLLDQGQIIQRVFNADDDALRTDANVTIIGDVTVEISAASGDNIALANSDGSKFVDVETVGGKNGLDVKIINTSVPVTGTVAISAFTAFQTSQYTIGLSAVQITPTPLTPRSGVGLKAICTSNNIIWIGNSSSVTSSTGYPLFNGDAVQLDLSESDTIYAIATAASQTLCAIELGN